MSKEKTLWAYIKRGMRDRWDACRHEDDVTLGVPDVSYGLRGVQGWIELKVVETWPKRSSTVVKVSHFTSWQRRWIVDRGRCGGRVWLLLKVDRSYLLFHWDDVHRVGTTTRKELIRCSTNAWHNNIDWEEFEEAVS